VYLEAFLAIKGEDDVLVFGKYTHRNSGLARQYERAVNKRMRADG
jgi:hypothetical protein|tara:strand:+ start:358 stop:492 length:135 start_codon:yes stop_codon:yes gene_type:complete